MFIYNLNKKTPKFPNYLYPGPDFYIMFLHSLAANTRNLFYSTFFFYISVKILK